MYIKYVVEPNRNLQVKYVHTRGKLLKILKYSNQSIIEYDLIPFEQFIFLTFYKDCPEYFTTSNKNLLLTHN